MSTKKPVKAKEVTEADSAFVLKLVLYLVLGALWINFRTPVEIGAFSLHGFPIGLCLGLLFASHDQFAIDRKIEYALLLVMTVITFFLPAGIVL